MSIITDGNTVHASSSPSEGECAQDCYDCNCPDGDCADQ